MRDLWGLTLRRTDGVRPHPSPSSWRRQRGRQLAHSMRGLSQDQNQGRHPSQGQSAEIEIRQAPQISPDARNESFWMEIQNGRNERASMKIEVGKKYRDESGDIAEVRCISEGYVFYMCHGGRHTSRFGWASELADAEEYWRPVELPPEPRKVPVYLYRTPTGSEFSTTEGPPHHPPHALLATAEFVIPPEKEK